MNTTTRTGCKDIWNAFMCEGAEFSKNDIPFCPTTAKSLPNNIITWEEAKQIHKKSQRNDKNYYYDAFVCFYIDDYKFDGARGIWNMSGNALKVLRHFAGVITPDFSTYQDFPDSIKRYNTYRMRTYGFWLGRQNISVINNVRWGTEETWDYCWDGIPKKSVVAIGTVGSSIRLLENRPLFETGIKEMVRVLEPHTIIVYGSANYKIFDDLRSAGINIRSYPGQTCKAFERSKSHE